MKRRLLVGVLVVLAVVMLRPLLYASGVEQTWIPGIYDNGDLDDAFALSVLKAIGAEAPPTVLAASLLLARLDPTPATSPANLNRVASASRAPPLL
jgi:hypothetical protein